MQVHYEAVVLRNSDGLITRPSAFAGASNRPVTSASWEDTQVFLSRLNEVAQVAGCLPAGNMFCRLRRTGSMLAVRERPQHIHGLMAFPVPMRIIIGMVVRIQ